MKCGILALQGNFNQHKHMLDMLGVENIAIRYSSELSRCDALIIPGGESSAISKQLNDNNIRKSIIDFSVKRPIFGTCAGMIMLSSTKSNDKISPLNIMNFEIKRNAWGRQTHSFSAEIDLKPIYKRKFHGIFIRAPKVNKYDQSMQILGTYNNEPVLMTDGKHLVSTFHPEVGLDMRIHNYFINSVNERLSAFK